MEKRARKHDVEPPLKDMQLLQLKRPMEKRARLGRGDMLAYSDAPKKMQATVVAKETCWLIAML